MNARWAAARAGVRRGWIELRHTFTTPSDLATLLITTAIFLGVMLFVRATTVPGTHFSLGTAMLAGVLGMNVGFSGLAMMAALLTIEHEDGTLLRAKAIPHGMIGYLIGKVVTVSGTVIFSVGGTLLAGLLLFSGLAVGSVGAWLTLIWVLALGLAATLPIGAVVGSLMPSARSAGLMNLVVGGLIAISGIFYPITHLPHWLELVGQAFPLYWLGLGMRSALLPAGLASVEIGHSWRHLATFGVLSLWAVVGLLVAPVLLRRMARREAGSSVAARREKAMQRV
ncbi:MAG TPA: ABC transporter permease [Streptosporangiaceae bacterium]